MSKFPHEREHTEGRSVMGDFMDDDLNEKIYNTLIEASQKIQAALDVLRDHDDTQSSFEMGSGRADVLKRFKQPALTFMQTGPTLSRT